MEHESDDDEAGGVSFADLGPAERRPGSISRDKRPAPSDRAYTENENNDNDTGGPSGDRRPGMRRRDKIPVSRHVGFQSNNNGVEDPSAASSGRTVVDPSAASSGRTVVDPSAASSGPAGRPPGHRRREKMPYELAPPHTGPSPDLGPSYRRPGSVRTAPRPWYEATSESVQMPPWLTPLAPPPGMAMIPVGSRPLQAPGVQKPDPDLEKLRTELHAMQAEISTSRLRDREAAEAGARAELVQRIRQEEERRIKDRMEAMHEAQETAKKEIELARTAAEATARERLEEAREAENEHHRAIAEMKAEAARQECERISIEEKEKEMRAREYAHTLAEIERNTIAKLEKEESEREEKKQHLDKERALIELETRIKVMAELKDQEKAIAAEASRTERAEELEAMKRKLLEAEIMNKATRAELMAELKHKEQATAAEESRKRRTKELEAREREVLKADIMNNCIGELLARERAVFEAEMENKYARQAQLDARERAIIEMETRHRFAADLAIQWEISSTEYTQSDDASSGTPTRSHSVIDVASSETSIGSYSIHEGVAPGIPKDDSNSHCTVNSPGHSTNSHLNGSHSSQGKQSFPCSHPNERSQSKSPRTTTISQADASSARGIPVDIDAFYIENASDVTVHIDLDLFQDIDDELEGFSRLSRIGSFANAESYFDLHLRAYLPNNPSLFVQYADMLFEKGDWKALMSLDSSSVFVRRDSQEPKRSDGELDQLELRNLILAMRLHKLTARTSKWSELAKRELSDWGDWRRIYWQLLSEGRIWDFRDAFVTVSETYGTKNALNAFLGDSSDSSIDGLLLDWKTNSRDESTELALLDLLSSTALAPDTSPDAGHLRETCLRLAEPIGKSLLDNSPHIIRSRIFVQWVIAKSVAGSGRGNFKYLENYRGRTVFPEFEPGMPYYVPIDGENPGWVPPDLTPTARQSLEMALKTSRETQDYRTEARCLQELSLGTQDPSKPLQELVELQKSKQHDMKGYLATCLTRYLICGNADTKATLLEDLKSLGSWDDPSDLFDPIRVADRNALERALSLKSQDNQL